MLNNIELLKIKASKGELEAQYQLGLILINDDNDNKKHESLYWIIEAAEGNYFPAQYFLGLSYLLGKTVDKNIDKAIYWFAKSANQGYAESQKRLGILYINGDIIEQDIKQAIYWFNAASEQGNALAQYYLGMIYLTFEPNNETKKLAYELFKKSAKQGNTDSQTSLGVMYLYGNGTKTNKQKAYKWLMESAQKNNSMGQYYLGVMYNSGNGIDKDKEKAINWLTKSANQNNLDAQFILGTIFYENEKKSDYQKAYYWFDKGSDMGDKRSMNFKSIMLFNGIGTLKDEEEALMIYEQIKNSDLELFSLNVLSNNEKNVDLKYSFSEGWYKNKKETSFLRAVNVEDVKRIHEINNNNSFKKLLDNKIETIEKANIFADILYLNNNSSFAIVDKKTEKLIGIINYHDISKKKTLTFYLDFNYWNKGIMSSMLYDSIIKVFNDYNFQEIYAKVKSNNIAAIKVLLKNKFKYNAFYKEFKTIKEYEEIYEFILKKEDL